MEVWAVQGSTPMNVDAVSTLPYDPQDIPDKSGVADFQTVVIEDKCDAFENMKLGNDSAPPPKKKK